ncbi:hypothetical protein [Streptomyces sp. F-1]|uniref:hypothetical protein n=1 Tax=Streptomyces sp. F-1 TaxID=463642 RepID=UPI00085BF495|nr:hypothetical protein [Streptomyces sp. F-1]SFY50910.1 hypothetical protein STEPF1_04166 [Streptomyces sp. F-1]
MADEQDKWLNRETAERLLAGEAAEAVDASAADRAERLFELLGALSAEAAPATSELPGEQAALAAFRKARDAAAEERVAAPGGRPGASARGHDAGLVRIGARTEAPARRPAWRRPVRLALAAVVAAGTLGGVAVAAGSGVLPTPFDEERPAPAASATASGRPLAPATTPQAPTGTAAPGGAAGTARSGGSDRATGPDGRTGTGTRPGSGAPSAPGGRWSGAATACRDLRAGTGLGADRRRALETLAGGSARVAQYCKLLLTTGEHTAVSPTPGKGGDDGGRGQGEGRGAGRGSGQGGGGDQNGNGQGGDDDSHPGNGNGKGSGLGKGGGRGSGAGQVRIRQRDGATPAPEPSAHGPRRPRSTAGAPSGSPSPSPS